MPTLYVITGPAGVGKSTVSKRLAEELSQSVLVEGDDIYNQVVGGYVSPWKEGNHLAIFWKVSIDVIRDYLEAGYDVVYNYIVSPDNLAALEAAFHDVSMKFVVLMVDEATLMQRDALRPEDCQMKERCLVLLHSFEKHGYPERYVVDTGKKNVDEIVECVMNEERFEVLY